MCDKTVFLGYLTIPSWALPYLNLTANESDDGDALRKQRKIELSKMQEKEFVGIVDSGDISSNITLLEGGIPKQDGTTTISLPYVSPAMERCIAYLEKNIKCFRCGGSNPTETLECIYCQMKKECSKRHCKIEVASKGLCQKHYDKKRRPPTI